MNIDRYMVNLFFEIKRNLPYQKREPLKISSPNLGELMVNLYHEIDDEAVKRLIEVFFERAGDDSFLKQLRENASAGKLDLLFATPNKEKNNKRAPAPKTRYYRGALVEV